MDVQSSHPFAEESGGIAVHGAEQGSQEVCWPCWHHYCLICSPALLSFRMFSCPLLSMLV